MQGAFVRRREFITLVGGAAASWPLVARAQRRAMPVIGILDSDVANAVTAFRSGLIDTGYVEGRDVAIELRSTADNERLPALASSRFPHDEEGTTAGLRTQAHHLRLTRNSALPLSSLLEPKSLTWL
jgi:hypothetical protein